MFQQKAGKDGVMFIIDCRSNMFEKNSDGIVFIYYINLII